MKSMANLVNIMMMMLMVLMVIMMKVMIMKIIMITVTMVTWSHIAAARIPGSWIQGDPGTSPACSTLPQSDEDVIIMIAVVIFTMMMTIIVCVMTNPVNLVKFPQSDEDYDCHYEEMSSGQLSWYLANWCGSGDFAILILTGDIDKVSLNRLVTCLDLRELHHLYELRVQLQISFVNRLWLH